MSLQPILESQLNGKVNAWLRTRGCERVAAKPFSEHIASLGSRTQCPVGGAVVQQSDRTSPGEQKQLRKLDVFS